MKYQEINSPCRYRSAPRRSPTLCRWTWISIASRYFSENERQFTVEVIAQRLETHQDEQEKSGNSNNGKESCFSGDLGESEINLDLGLVEQHGTYGQTNRLPSSKAV